MVSQKSNKKIILYYFYNVIYCLTDDQVPTGSLEIFSKLEK